MVRAYLRMFSGKEYPSSVKSVMGHQALYVAMFYLWI
jgi:hypothetical protein